MPGKILASEGVRAQFTAGRWLWEEVLALGTIAELVLCE